MRCHRCDGLLVLDHFIDMGDSSCQLWLRAWRCVNCGMVEDPAIGRRHRESRRGLPASLKPRAAQWHRSREVIRLTA